MKVLILIMTSTILFLSVKPGIEVFSLQTNTEQGCCGGDCEPISGKDGSQEKQGDDCDGKSCNPFQMCSSCVLYFPLAQYDFPSEPLVLEIPDFSYHSVFIPQFTFDFWHPPQIV